MWSEILVLNTSDQAFSRAALSTPLYTLPSLSETKCFPSDKIMGSSLQDFSSQVEYCI